MTVSFMRLGVGLAVAGLAIGGLIGAVRAESPQSPGTWTMKTPMPTASTVARKAMSKETCAPFTILLSTSRPVTWSWAR